MAFWLGASQVLLLISLATVFLTLSQCKANCSDTLTVTSDVHLGDDRGIAGHFETSKQRASSSQVLQSINH